jgi:hypothetical protein
MRFNPPASPQVIGNFLADLVALLRILKPQISWLARSQPGDMGPQDVADGEGQLVEGLGHMPRLSTGPE